MRSKEEAHDYRYFADPDLLPLVVKDSMIDEITKNIPELPLVKLQNYQDKLGLNLYDAEILTSERSLADFFETAIQFHNNPKNIANWIINEVLRSNKEAHDSDSEVGEFKTSITPHSIAELVKLIDAKTISNTIAKKVFALILQNPEKSPLQIVEENKWHVVSDDKEIENFIIATLKENEEEVEKFKAGKTKVLGFLMGQIMKKAKGKIAPERAQEMLTEYLKKI
ncbi:MAG: Aspartyl/glutamyl-tRNA(Asn/Gln) amidotransferase subunit B [bacterium ADurb.BinA186]|nr:MAG: Aspartyl/glutamyl-tRNA(Asn/Gln) amidotransferase subunit B [bacterium ADurb.BinA186]